MCYKLCLIDPEVKVLVMKLLQKLNLIPCVLISLQASFPIPPLSHLPLQYLLHKLGPLCSVTLLITAVNTLNLFTCFFFFFGSQRAAGVCFLRCPGQIAVIERSDIFKQTSLSSSLMYLCLCLFPRLHLRMQMSPDNKGELWLEQKSDI